MNEKARFYNSLPDQYICLQGLSFDQKYWILFIVSTGLFLLRFIITDFEIGDWFLMHFNHSALHLTVNFELASFAFSYNMNYNFN